MICGSDAWADFVVGRVTPSRQRELQDHVEHCEACSIEVAELRQLASTLGLSAIAERKSGVAWLRDYEHELTDEKAVAAIIVPHLLAQPPNRWRAVVAADDRIRTPRVVMAVLEAAQRMFYGSPVRAHELASLAVDVAELADDCEAAWRARATAYRKLATALEGLGRYTDALQVLDVAETCVSPIWPDANYEFALVEYGRAYVLRAMGRVIEARRKIGPAAETFLEYGQRKQWADARHLEGVILFSEGKPQAAMEVFTSMLDEMRAAGDDVLEAGCHHNIGHCHRAAGRFEEAINAWARAAELFERARAHGETVRLRWGIGKLLVETGEFDRGLAALRDAEAGFNELAMAGESILIGLDIVELLSGEPNHAEEVITRCRSLARRARGAGMPRQSEIALAYLRKAAMDSRGRVEADVVRHVRQFLEDIEVYPSLRFAPPQIQGRETWTK